MPKVTLVRGARQLLTFTGLAVRAAGPIFGTWGLSKTAPF